MNKVLILGATSAIAEAVARRFAADRARLYLIGRQADALAGIAADLRVRGATAVDFAAADLTDRTRHAALIDQAWTVLDGIDGVLLAYGMLGDQAALAAEPEATARLLDTNLVSAAALLTLIAGRLEEQRHGSLAVIGSVAGDRGRAGNYVYGASKAGLATFTQGLRHRLAHAGVGVTLVKPGFVDTPMTAALPKGPLFVSPDRVARDIHRGLIGSPAVIYSPWFWRWIMLAIRLLPDFVFQRIRL